jgi:hypothetical protein
MLFLSYVGILWLAGFANGKTFGCWSGSPTSSIEDGEVRSRRKKLSAFFC